tara:strand:- start:1244 stop:1720 length:477 start_codon:yes stop_codon:yes gene_type:complete
MAIDYSRLPSDASPVEILTAVSKLKTKKEKIELLRQYENHPGFMHILRGAYADNIEWLVPDGPLPEGVLPSAAPSVDTAEDRLIRAFRNFQYLVKGGADVRQSKREEIYLNMYRSLHNSEAELLHSIVNKKLPYKGITKAIVADAFPNVWTKEDEASS